MVQRQNRVRDALAEVIKQSQPHPVHIEAHTASELDDKHPDIQWWPDGGADEWLDITIVTPTMRAVRASAARAERAGVVAAAKEQAKRAKYPALRLTPFVLEAWGRVGDGAAGFVRRLCPYTEAAERSAWVVSTWRALQTTAGRGTVRLLHSHGQLRSL